MYDQERIFLKQKVTGMNLLGAKNGGCPLEFIALRMQRIGSVSCFLGLTIYGIRKRSEFEKQIKNVFLPDVKIHPVLFLMHLIHLVSIEIVQ
jgi:hypothetical protein